jgi:hypothetical protein
MFANATDVQRITGYEVDNELVVQAQAIIEMYVGKSEARVESPDDRYLLHLATAYQAAYMHENADTVFKQIAVRLLSQADYQVALDTSRDAPYIAPLAGMCVERLSWKGTRSLTTAPAFRAPHLVHWRYD